MHALRELERPMKWTMTACNEYPQRFAKARALGLRMGADRGLTPTQTEELLRYHWVAGDMSKMF